MIIKLFPDPCYAKVNSIINAGLLKAKITIYNYQTEKGKVDIKKFKDGDSGEQESEEDLERLNSIDNYDINKLIFTVNNEEIVNF